jgi:hypothetical protein
MVVFRALRLNALAIFVQLLVTWDETYIQFKPAVVAGGLVRVMVELGPSNVRPLSIAQRQIGKCNVFEFETARP